MEEDRYEVLPTGELRKKYYKINEAPPRISLNPAKVPAGLRSLIPLAELWGISDDLLRMDHVRTSTPEGLTELRDVISAHEDQLDQWLAGPDSNSPSPSLEYLAFSCMRMAVDGC